jgi:hypothetical protein
MISYNVYRNFNLSLIKVLKDIAPTGVSVVDETEENLTTSTIGVYPGPISWQPFEHGNRDDLDIHSWFVGVYANTPQERDYLALLIYNKLKEWSIPVLDFSNEEAALGFLLPKNIRVEPKRAPEEVVDKLRYFSIVSFQTIYQEI